MKEYAVFVPVAEQHIAAIVTVPDDDPHAVVVMTTGGGGAPRSQRFRLWTRVARELADRGIASLRMEYAGVGDSTGVARVGLDVHPVDDLVAVATYAMEVTGTRRLGLCGNCAGARTSVRATETLTSTESLVLFWLKPLASSDRSRWRLAPLVRMLHVLPSSTRRRLTRVYWRREARSGRGAKISQTLERIAPDRDILLLETQSDLAGPIPELVEELQRRDRGRIELRGFESTSMAAFESERDQDITVETVVGWFERSFSAPPAVRPGDIDAPRDSVDGVVAGQA